MHKAFFGDRERDFALTPHLIPELERLAGRGIAAVVDDMVLNRRAWFAEITAVIRLALIGAGAPPQEADTLVKTYVPIRPLAEAHLLAMNVLLDLWSGPAADVLDDLDEAAATGDLSAAINADAAGWIGSRSRPKSQLTTPAPSPASHGRSALPIAWAT